MLYLEFRYKGQYGEPCWHGFHICDEEALARLKLNYTRDSNAIKGDWYKCTFEGEEESRTRMVEVKFNDINEIQYE